MPSTLSSPAGIKTRGLWPWTTPTPGRSMSTAAKRSAVVVDQTLALGTRSALSQSKTA